MNEVGKREKYGEWAWNGMDMGMGQLYLYHAHFE